MNKEKKTRVTLEDIVAAKKQREKDRLRVEEIEIPSMGKTLLFKRPKDSLIFEYIDTVQKDESTETVIGALEEIIYLCCDELQSQELQSELEVTNPVKTVSAFMSADDILTVGDKVCSLNSIYGNLEEELKN